MIRSVALPYTPRSPKLSLSLEIFNKIFDARLVYLIRATSLAHHMSSLTFEVLILKYT